MSQTVLVNGVERAVAPTTVTKLLRDENVDPAARFVAVAVNGVIVPRSSWGGAQVAPGDEVEIVRPAPGG